MEEVVRVIPLFKETEAECILDKIELIIDRYDLSNSTKYGYNYYGSSNTSGFPPYNKSRFSKLRDDYNSCLVSTEKDYLLLPL